MPVPIETTEITPQPVLQTTVVIKPVPQLPIRT